MPAAANPTTPSLWAGRIFTTLVFVLALAGMTDALFIEAGSRAAYLFMAAGLIYMVGAIVLFVRGDYILRLFGCAWPFALPKVDEMQQLHRQRAFAATFAIFIALFSFFVGIQVGSVAVDVVEGVEPTGLMPTDVPVQVLSLCFVLLALSLAPQAYLAWTLKPLDEDVEDEAAA